MLSPAVTSGEDVSCDSRRDGHALTWLSLSSEGPAVTDLPRAWPAGSLPVPLYLPTTLASFDV